MTKSTSGERERRTTDAPVANVPYIDPPTIPAGMTVTTYRCVRVRRKQHGIRRLGSPSLWLG